MSTPKVIAVIGATGAQGGSLAQAILDDASHEFACRAITRNPESDAARLLLTKGSEVIAADLDDIDSLVAAFTGAHGVFCVTNFWEHFSGEKE
ncbi:MAG: NmrA family NAD(P)-binding protein, partial [Gemmatimonadaceae bacterium]